MCAATLAAGCATTKGTTTAGETPDDRVWNIRLSSERGEVGKPFQSEVTFQRNFDGEVEFDVGGLPPGLSFDDKTKAIVGKPTQAGFFTVNVAVRKHVARGRWHRPKADEHWWRQEVSLEIYTPMRD